MKQRAAGKNSSADAYEREPLDPGDWDHLTPPPRSVPGSIRLRLALSEFGVGVGFACFFGTLALLIGAVFAGVVAGDAPGGNVNPAVPFVIGLAVLLLGVSVWAGIVWVLLSRSRRGVQVLAHGELISGEIAKVLDRTTNKFRDYREMVDEWAEFQKATAPMRAMMFGIRSQLKNWPVKLLVDDPSGHTAEIDARVDLGPRLTGAMRDPRVRLLVDRQAGDSRCVAVEQLSWLGVSDFGNLTYAASRDAEESGFGRSLLRSLLVVIPTYCLAAIGLRFGVAPLFGQGGNNDIPPLMGAGVVLMFTLTHGVVPVFFYRIFAGALDAVGQQVSRWNPAVLFASGFVYLHMGFWYGVPVVGLAAMTGWLSLAWVIGHMIFAGRGMRRWTFLEHGSTSMALLLFLVCFSGQDLFPVGIVVVLFQSLLLTLVDWKGRGLWVKEGSSS